MVEYIYDAWGNHIVTPTEEAYAELSQLNPFRYRGYYYDTETGLYFLKTRYYDPEVGRFITIDDLSYLDPETINGLNLYAYCGNNPVMAVDPNGTFFFTLMAIFAGIAISAAVGGVVGGITEVANGGSFLDGFVGGAITGVISGIGIAIGLAVPGIGGLLAAGLLGVIGGFGGSTVQQGMSNGWDNIDWGTAVFTGLVSGLFNIVTLGFTSLIANGVGAISGTTFLQKFVSALKLNPYTSLVAGCVLGFPFSLLSIVPSYLWDQFYKKGGN